MTDSQKNKESCKCKSVFKSGENINSVQFTKKWIEMINKIEKGKSANFRRR